jgi:energy-coupling factor transporter ATP-binding protein EcfA2
VASLPATSEASAGGITRALPIFEARGLTKVYQMDEVRVRALRGVDMDLYHGEFMVLLGPSGSGKSSLTARENVALVTEIAERPPESMLQRVQAIDGVDRAASRVVALVRLDMPGFDGPVTALMVSASTAGSDGLNALYLRQGRLPAAGRPDEVVVSTPFAEAHGLLSGARSYAITSPGPR